MNTAAIVIVSLAAGVLLVILIAGMATLIFLHLRSQKAQKALDEKLTLFADSLEESLEMSNRELTTIIEGARASFGGIRQEIKGSLDASAKSVQLHLAENGVMFRREMDKINATELHLAAGRGIEAANRMVQVAATLQQLLISHEVPQPGADLGPEDYAPPDTIYHRQSDTARMDAADQQVEAEENAPQMSGGMA